MARLTSIDRDIARLAIPALGTLAAEPLVSLVDTAFVGRLGAGALGALGIDAAILGFGFFVFTFLAYATTPLVATAVAGGDRKRASELSTEALVLAVGFGVVGLVLVQLATPVLLEFMGASGRVVDPATVYLRIRVLGLPAVLLITVANGIFRGMQNTTTPLVVTLALNVVNIVLDPLLIFGLGWGVAGAATASAVAQWSGALWFVWLLVRGRAGIPLSPRVPRLSELGRLLSAGSALTLRSLALVSFFALATRAATQAGVVAVAAHQVASQVWLFLALVVDAVAIAAQALIAKHLGAGDRDLARRTGDRMLGWGLAWGLLLGLVFWLLRFELPTWFTTDAAVVATVAAIMPFVALTQPLNALVFVWDGIYVGAGEFRFVAVWMVVATAASAVALTFTTSITGVWWVITMLMVLRVMPLAARHATTLS